MIKIWRGNENTDDKIIALSEIAIHKGNPTNLEIDDCLTDLKNDIIPQKGFITIPISYIKEIQLNEARTYIVLLFGQDSEEHLKLNDHFLRNEIFTYFKEHIPNIKFQYDKYSKIRSARKPMIAMSVIIGLFLWSLYYAIEFEKGNQYDISNGHYNSLTGIVLAIASYGVINVVAVFGILFAIALFAFIRKYRNPLIINRLIFTR